MAMDFQSISNSIECFANTFKSVSVLFDLVTGNFESSGTIVEILNEQPLKLYPWRLQDNLFRFESGYDVNIRTTRRTYL
jgi:hypothetical protein